MSRPKNSALDITGMVFGRYIVLRRDGEYKSGTPLWLCRCMCGIEKRVTSYSLKNGIVKSCGCYHKDDLSKRLTTHGHTKAKITRTYRCWSNMIQRCTNSKNDHYYLYGGRGIAVCNSWRDFSNFLMDMGECPANLTIERTDNNKGYYKENCRWATPDEQRKNKRPQTRKKAA